MERIEAGLLIAGDEEPVRGGVVLVDGGTISYAGPAGNAPETPAATVHRAATVMPGLWDCHGGLTSPGRPARGPGRSQGPACHAAAGARRPAQMP